MQLAGHKGYGLCLHLNSLCFALYIRSSSDSHDSKLL